MAATQPLWWSFRLRSPMRARPPRLPNRWPPQRRAREAASIHHPCVACLPYQWVHTREGRAAPVVLAAAPMRSVAQMHVAVAHRLHTAASWCGRTRPRSQCCAIANSPLPAAPAAHHPVCREPTHEVQADSRGRARRSQRCATRAAMMWPMLLAAQMERVARLLRTGASRPIVTEARVSPSWRPPTAHAAEAKCLCADSALRGRARHSQRCATTTPPLTPGERRLRWRTSSLPGNGLARRLPHDQRAAEPCQQAPSPESMLCCRPSRGRHTAFRPPF